MWIIILAFIVAFIIIAMAPMIRQMRSEKLTTTEIVAQFDRTKKNRGSIFDFRSAIGDTQFSPYKYAQLTTLYETGKLSLANAAQVLGNL